MPEVTTEKDSVQTQTPKKKRLSGWLLILLIVFLILFLLTSAILGSRLYQMATWDRHTVDLAVGELDGTIELFRIEYANESGEITVQGANGENVVAPGTTVNYDIRLRNKDDVVIDFVMTPDAKYLNEDKIAIEFKLVDDYGNYLLGSETAWATVEELNALNHKGSIHPGEIFTYHMSWHWIFEVSDEHDAYDTYLANQDGATLPGIMVTINTDSVANPTPPKSNTHMAHLLGEGFGCCWCCYLVWLLVLICLVLVIWVCRLRRKYNKLVDKLEEYEKLLESDDLGVDVT